MNKAYFLTVLTCLFLTACGGGGGGGSSTSSTAPATTLTLSGTAATGAAIAGETISAVCASTGGGIVSPVTTPSNTDGTFTLNFTAANVSLPCILKVTATSTGKSYYSLLESGATSNIANITPISYLVSDLVFGVDSATVYANFASYVSLATSANVTKAQTIVKNALLALAIDVTSYDLLKASFIATNGGNAGDAYDKALDALAITMAIAELEVSNLSTSLRVATSSNAGSIAVSSVGLSATSLSTCPSARSGNYWIIGYDGNNVSEWTINLSTMRAGNTGSGVTYPVAAVSGQPCAYTVTTSGLTSNYVITAYVSKSGIFSWKQLYTSGPSNGGNYFGIGVPVQSLQNITDSQYVGDYNALIYANVLEGSQVLAVSAAMKFHIASGGAVTSATCTLGGSYSCGVLSSSNSNNPASCSANSAGMITCTGNGFTAKVFLVTIQQQPMAFMAYSGTDSTVTAPGTFSALAVLSKARTLNLPAVGATQNSSLDWFVSREPKNNANTTWTFNSGNTSTGASTTVTSVDTVNNSDTWSDGLTWHVNSPLAGMYWYSSGASGVGLSTNAGFSMRVTAASGSTTYDGLEFFVAKP
jgi:hypothetical protein